jgi:probable F420-dependent oxidoreductase
VTEPRLRFTYSIGMPDPAQYVTLARAAEEAGWDTIAVPDSICYPRTSSSKYPYRTDGGREFLENKRFIDPFSLVSFMAAVTSRVDFFVNVLKLPVRHPVLVAKQVASVAVLSANRLQLGVGSSPWPDDYEICQVPWEQRGQRLDEAIEIVRDLTRGGYVEHSGAMFTFPPIKLEPVPDQPVPIVVGGQSDAALRRAARVGDGWTSAGSTEEQLVDHIARLRVERERAERSHLPFRVYVRSPRAATPEGVEWLRDAGVTDVVLRFQETYGIEPDDAPLDQRLDALRRYADTVIAHVER